MRDFFQKLKNHNVMFLILIFCVGLCSYIGDIFFAKSQLKSNVLINSLALVLIYLYDKKLGTVMYFLGACSGFYLVRLYNFAPFMDIYVLLFSSLYMSFYSNIFKKIINQWDLKKTLNYFIYSTLVMIFIYILFLFIAIYIFILINNGGNKVQILNISSILKYQLGAKPLISIANLSFSKVILNILILNTSYWASILLFFINLKNNSNSMIHMKLDIFNIPVHKNYKYIFAISVFTTALSMYWSLWTTYIFLPISIGLLFLFFIIGREIILNILYKITPNFLIVNVILMIFQSCVPLLTFIMIAFGIVEVYCKIWNGAREE